MSHLIDDGPAAAGAGKPGFFEWSRPGSLEPDLGGALWFVVALAVSAGMIFDGFDGAAGLAMSCLVNSTLLILLLALCPPPLRFWRTLWPLLALAMAALTWATAIFVLHGTTPAGEPIPFAPDLFGAHAASYVGNVAILISGAIVGLNQRARTVLDWLIGVAVLCLLAGLVLREFDAPGVFDYWTLQRDGRFTGLIGNANVTATVAGAIAILAFAGLLVAGRSLGSRKVGRRNAVRIGFYALAFTISLGATIATASRFAALVTLILVAALAVVAMWRSWQGLRRMVWPIAGATLLAAALLTQAGDLLGDRLTSMSKGFDDRSTMWHHYLVLAEKSPILGYGIGSFPTVNAHFLPSAQFAGGFWNVNSPHGILLQLVLGGGVPYLLCLLLAAVMAARTIAFDLVRRGDIESFGSAAAVVLIVTCGAIDIALDMAVTVSLMLFLSGTLLGRKMTR